MELLAYIPTLYISGLTSLIVSTVLTLFKNTTTQALSLVKTPLKQNILSTTIVGNMKNNTPIPHFALKKGVKIGIVLFCDVACYSKCRQMALLWVKQKGFRNLGSLDFTVVPKAGLEPARICIRQILSLCRTLFRLYCYMSFCDET